MMKRDMDDVPVEDIPHALLINPPYSSKAKNTLYGWDVVCRPVNFEPVWPIFTKIGSEHHAVEVHPNAVRLVLPSFITRQTVCLQRNTDSRSCNHCWSWKSSKCYIFWVCVCSLSYPSRNAHAPYCHLWSARLYNIFPHYLINVTILGGGGNIEHHLCVLSFSTTFAWSICHSEKNSARYYHKCILVFM